jgi:hypothetical protein
MGNDSRRKFIKGIAGTALAASVPQMIRASGIEKKEELKLRDYYSANDNIQVALIGAVVWEQVTHKRLKQYPG